MNARHPAAGLVRVLPTVHEARHAAAWDPTPAQQAEEIVAQAEEAQR